MGALASLILESLAGKMVAPWSIEPGEKLKVRFPFA